MCLYQKFSVLVLSLQEKKKKKKQNIGFTPGETSNKTSSKSQGLHLHEKKTVIKKKKPSQCLKFDFQ